MVDIAATTEHHAGQALECPRRNSNLTEKSDRLLKEFEPSAAVQKPMKQFSFAPHEQLLQPPVPQQGQSQSVLSQSDDEAPLVTLRRLILSAQAKEAI